MLNNQNLEEHKKTLKNQHYGLIGNHSGVKICSWTKKSIKDEGFCYKQKFYGIRSHLCCQMSPSVGFCCNNCIHCWRTLGSYKEFNPDDPKEIIKGCVTEQRRLLSGLKGYEGCNLKKFKAAQNPEHFAISLSGEPTMYPKLNALIRLLHKKNKTTFLVSNGMFPDIIENLAMPTQFYLSLNTPNKRLFQPVHNSNLKDGWERLNQSLEIIRDMKTRTTIRATMIKGVNMIEPENWAKLIEKASPMFVEVKSYMFIGSSRQRLKLDNMPYHKEIIEFANKISKYSSYKIIDDKPKSRVVLMMKKDREDRIMEF